MLVIYKVQGNVFDVNEVHEIPSVGEVVTIEEIDFVISNLSLPSSPVNVTGLPVLNLLPIVSCVG